MKDFSEWGLMRANHKIELSHALVGDFFDNQQKIIEAELKALGIDIKKGGLNYGKM